MGNIMKFRNVRNGEVFRIMAEKKHPEKHDTGLFVKVGNSHSQRLNQPDKDVILALDDIVQLVPQQKRRA